MEPDEYARIAAAEDEHWWYQGTRALAAQLLDPWLGRPGLFLDAGCGPGGNGAWLAERGTVVGVDRAVEALALLGARHPDVYGAIAIQCADGYMKAMTHTNFEAMYACMGGDQCHDACKRRRASSDLLLLNRNGRAPPSEADRHSRNAAVTH